MYVALWRVRSSVQIFGHYNRVVGSADRTAAPRRSSEPRVAKGFVFSPASAAVSHFFPSVYFRAISFTECEECVFSLLPAPVSSAPDNRSCVLWMSIAQVCMLASTLFWEDSHQGRRRMGSGKRADAEDSAEWALVVLQFVNLIFKLQKVTTPALAYPRG